MMRNVRAATIIATLHMCFAASGAYAAGDNQSGICADDTHTAIEQARQSLRDNSGTGDRTALTCLVEAVAALDARMRGLADGSLPFEGQIYAPKGVVMNKPSDQGGR